MQTQSRAEQTGSEDKRAREAEGRLDFVRHRSNSKYESAAVIKYDRCSTLADDVNSSGVHLEVTDRTAIANRALDVDVGDELMVSAMVGG